VSSAVDNAIAVVARIVRIRSEHGGDRDDASTGVRVGEGEIIDLRFIGSVSVVGALYR
jgi:hypothetical protein